MLCISYRDQTIRVRCRLIVETGKHEFFTHGRIFGELADVEVVARFERHLCVEHRLPSRGG